jgi:hypothetical protein
MAFLQPPQINYAQSPYARVPLPSQFLQTQLPALNPMLQKGAVISWSVCEPPSTAVSQMVLPYGEVWQNQPATSPCTCSLAIWSKPTGDRPIVVRRQPYVTVGDVLIHVHQAIRRAAREHFQPTPQPLLFHPHTYPQSPPVVGEQQVQQWVLHYLNGRFTWKGLTPYEADSWWLDIR